MVGPRTGGLGNKWTNRDHPNYNIIKIDQNTEKSPEDLGRLAVTQTAVRNHRLTLPWKLKECEKKDEYLDLTRELKKLWNMQVTIIPTVIDAFGTVTNGLLKGLENMEVGGRVETIQTTALLTTARILRRVLETWADLLSPKLQWETIG